MLFFLQSINQIQFKRLNLNGIMFYQIYFAASERPLVYTNLLHLTMASIFHSLKF